MTDKTPSAAAGSRQFAAFVIVGIASAACNLASRYLFEVFVSYEVALAGSNVFGLLSAFFMNRWLVFRPGGDSMVTELVRFTLVNLGGITVTWIAAVLLYRQIFPAVGFLWHADFVAHAIGIAIPVIPNYLAHRFWTFAK